MRFKLESGVTFDEIIAALDEGPTSGDGIRIATHVQSIGPGGDSDTFICCSRPGDLGDP